MECFVHWGMEIRTLLYLYDPKGNWVPDYYIKKTSRFISLPWEIGIRHKNQIEDILL
jgi:hypothetical protein